MKYENVLGVIMEESEDAQPEVIGTLADTGEETRQPQVEIWIDAENHPEQCGDGERNDQPGPIHRQKRARLDGTAATAKTMRARDGVWVGIAFTPCPGWGVEHPAASPWTPLTGLGRVGQGQSSDRAAACLASELRALLADAAL